MSSPPLKQCYQLPSGLDNKFTDCEKLFTTCKPGRVVNSSCDSLKCSHWRGAECVKIQISVNKKGNKRNDDHAVASHAARLVSRTILKWVSSTSMTPNVFLQRLRGFPVPLSPPYNIRINRPQLTQVRLRMIAISQSSRFDWQYAGIMWYAIKSNCWSLKLNGVPFEVTWRETSYG